MSQVQRGSVDFDLICHLGALKNVDIWERGLYFMQVTMKYGWDLRHTVVPVAVFSAPSTLDSFVGSQRVHGLRTATFPCHVDEDTHSFRSRTFMVRYQGECYDINEGVHFRLTVPNVDISVFHGSRPITSPEPVNLRIELLHAEFTAAAIKDSSTDLEACIPEDPLFKVLASQDVRIPRFSSGLQAYLPINFARGTFIALDMMIHMAATAIRYQSVSPAVQTYTHNKLTNPQNRQ